MHVADLDKTSFPGKPRIAKLKLLAAKALRSRESKNNHADSHRENDDGSPAITQRESKPQQFIGKTEGKEHKSDAHPVVQNDFQCTAGASKGEPQDCGDGKPKSHDRRKVQQGGIAQPCC